MLIPLDVLTSNFVMNIKGVLHIGAHECEEQTAYLKQGVLNDNIYWIEAMKNKVELMKQQNPDYNIFQAVISDVNDEEVNFNITNNGQSSSILELGTHKKHHPHVWVEKQESLKTTRLDTLIEKCKIPIEKLNFMNLDIQGAELKALKSMAHYIDNIDYIYTEVNTEYVYKDCALLNEIDEYLNEKGFERKCVRIYNNCGWGDAFYMRKGE